jgi:CRP-like cAMP-binding protein
VTETTIDDLTRADEAFAGNRLLSTFSREARALLEPHGEMVELDSGETVLSGGRAAEVASIGREGAVGGIVSCGHAPAYSRAQVLVPGPGFKISMDALEDAKKRSPFIEHLFCRFSDYLLAQVMQSAVCNAFHSIPERAARWLLHAQDRAGDRIELTQEAFAGLLGVQRTTVNAVIQQLSSEGLISTGRGKIFVTDRAGLKRRACECYERLEQHFAAVIGTSGHGAA